MCFITFPHCSLCRNVENFEAVLVSLITSENFRETLSITREDIALLARPVSCYNIQSQFHCANWHIFQVMAEIHVDSPFVFNISSVDGELKYRHLVNC